MLTVLEYLLLAFLIAIDVVASRWIGLQAYHWMPYQATAEAQKVDDLFSFLVSVGAFIFLGITGVILYSVLFFRASPQDYSEGHPGRGNWKVEVLWTGVPTVLVIWIALQSASIYDQINILGLTPIVHLHNPLEAPAYAKETDNQSKPAAEEIEVIAKQWEWTFRYPNQTVSHELHLPVNESVRLILHSQDVLHGFYIPEFRVKQDIIPARTITFVVTPTRAGRYRLRDSQFSGTYFAVMETDVLVESRTAYHQWMDAIAQSPNAPLNQAVAEQIQSPKRFFNSGWEIPAAVEAYQSDTPNSPVPSKSQAQGKYAT
jgi:cytochrome c oxidase subunit 2